MLRSDGIKGFDKRNLSLEEYDLYKTLGIDPVRFYRNEEEAERYRPNPNLTLPSGTTKVGNSTITFKEGYPHTNKAVSRNSLRDYTDYGSWHVVDPDNGYDFTIRSGRLRDGGSRTIDLHGNYPSEWNQHTGIIRYNGFGGQKNYDSATNKRNALNDIFKVYNLQFEKKGGNLPFYQKGNSIISKHPSSKNTSSYAADATYYDKVISKFGDPSKRFDAQYLLDNNEYGYDQEEDWREDSEGKFTRGDYSNPKYDIGYGSYYMDFINNKGERYREILFDEPNGGIDDMYTPAYRFRYKFDPKQNKYIPTNEWFMDKVVYRKRGGNLNKYQNGKNLPTAESAKVRYKGARGRRYGNGKFGNERVTIQEIENPDTNAKIELSILGEKDSIINEIPPHSWYVTTKKRTAYNDGYDKKEWNIMKRRWEEAKKVMSRKPYYAGPLYGTYPLPE